MEGHSRFEILDSNYNLWKMTHEIAQGFIISLRQIDQGYRCGMIRFACYVLSTELYNQGFKRVTRPGGN